MKKTGRLFSSILLLFFIPVILAKVFYTHKSWLPRHTLNQGQLLTPPRDLQQLGLSNAATHHRWVLLFVITRPCDASCQRNVYTMRQIQRALGKDSDRLQRVLLTVPEAIDDAKFWQLLSVSETSQWLVTKAALARVWENPSAWYVVDPLGNIILSYSAQSNPEAMLNDLKYLMRVSNIG